MLDLQFIRDHPDHVKQACSQKNLPSQVVDHILEKDTLRRQLITKTQDLRAQRNRLNNQLKSARDPKLIAQSKTLKSQLQDLEPQLRQLDSALHDLLLQVPNLPLPEVPVGPDDSGNQLVREWGQRPEFDFSPLDHIQLGLKLKLFDLDRGAKLAGFRGYFLTGSGVQLALGLMQFALNRLTTQGFTPIIPPIINRRSAFINSGHFPWGEKEAYQLASDETDPDNDYFLAGTAEVPLVSYHAGETLAEKDLPLKYLGFSPCYRREIGNYGKDTRGLYRVHEFFKVEQVILCRADLDESRHWHEQLLQYTEALHQELGLPYRVMLMCTGDMGEPQAKKYDLDVWMPGRADWGESASDSIMTDFQSRRANIRYQAADGSLKFVHMLNDTALTSLRPLIAILENFQNKDGSVKLPAPLVPFVGQEVLTP